MSPDPVGGHLKDQHIFEPITSHFRRRDTTVPLRHITNASFARDLQDRLGILSLLALSAPFRICKLQIPLAMQETDPVSGHHLE
jgi:hypothetical protein